MTTVTSTRPAPATTADPLAEVDTTMLRGTMGSDRQSRGEQVALALFIGLPFLAVLAAVPVAWGGWLG